MYNCTLNNCKSPKRLISLLNIHPTKFSHIIDESKNNPLKNLYTRFEKKDRELFICSPVIKHIHSRLKKLFELETPDYLQSGIKKRSSIVNAKYHSESRFFLLVDIKSFYPSITKSKIKKQLIRTYRQSADVAEIVANLVTVPQKKSKGSRALVTGSLLSQYFAFMINKKMFDELNKLSLSQGIKFSVYVDDISFSSATIIPHTFYMSVYSIVRNYEYQLHKGAKLYRGRASEKSIITGVKITRYGLRLKDKHKNEIRKIIKDADCDNNKKRLYGLLNYAKQVNTKYDRYMSKFDFTSLAAKVKS